MPTFKIKIEKIIKDYKTDPRNKIFIDEETLLAAAIEETGDKVTAPELRSVIGRFIDGEMEDDDYSVYDGATYACATVANICFADPSRQGEDDSVDYQLEWIENTDGSYCAEIRPD